MTEQGDLEGGAEDQAGIEDRQATATGAGSHHTFLLETHDGVPVVVHQWQPSGQVRGVLNLVHGMVEHAARYAHVADALNDAGIAVYAADLRGHGETAHSDADLGIFAEERGWARVLDDVHRITLRARAEHPELPVFLLGHSMGSFLVQQYLFTFPSDVDGAVLSSVRRPGGVAELEAGAVIARMERLRSGPRGTSRLLTALTFGAYNRAFTPARTDFDWLSRDPDTVDRYLADPRCGFPATTQFYVDMFAGLRLIQQLERVRGVPSELPIYVFAGSRDPMGGGAAVERLAAFYAQAGVTDVQTRVYDDARHETLNETNRDEVIADLITWLDGRIRALLPT